LDSLSAATAKLKRAAKIMRTNQQTVWPDAFCNSDFNVPKNTHYWAMCTTHFQQKIVR
jgi:hypothetical protein